MLGSSTGYLLDPRPAGIIVNKQRSSFTLFRNQHALPVTIIVNFRFTLQRKIEISPVRDTSVIPSDDHLWGYVVPAPPRPLCYASRSRFRRREPEIKQRNAPAILSNIDREDAGKTSQSKLSQMRSFGRSAPVRAFLQSFAARLRRQLPPRRVAIACGRFRRHSEMDGDRETLAATRAQSWSSPPHSAHQGERFPSRSHFHAADLASSSLSLRLTSRLPARASPAWAEAGHRQCAWSTCRTRPLPALPCPCLHLCPRPWPSHP